MIYQTLAKVFLIRSSGPQVGRPPPAEQPTISTVRRWEEIVHPESVSEADLDSIIFDPEFAMAEDCHGYRQTLERCQTLALPVSAEVLGARILALAEADRREGEGDLRKRRFSEVRLNAEERRDV